MVPTKSKDNHRNNLYVKNIPSDFTDDDLKKLFAKYGQITSAIVSKDDKGQCKGFGFVCFANESEADLAYKDMNENSFSFPNLSPIYVNYTMKKQERKIPNETLERFHYQNTKFVAFHALDFDPDIVNTN